MEIIFVGYMFEFPASRRRQLGDQRGARVGRMPAGVSDAPARRPPFTLARARLSNLFSPVRHRCRRLCPLTRPHPTSFIYGGIVFHIVFSRANIPSPPLELPIHHVRIFETPLWHLIYFPCPLMICFRVSHRCRQNGEPEHGIYIEPDDQPGHGHRIGLRIASVADERRL